MLTTSTSEGYSYVFRLLCNPDDEVLVPKPSYPLFEFLADLQDVKLVPYPLLYDHGWQIDFPSLSRTVTPRTRAVVVVHPNNPTGSYVSSGERTQLNSFCREHGLALIVDEVFLDYPHDGVHQAELRGQSGCADIYAQRPLENLWPAADEAGLGCNQWPAPAAIAAMDRLEVIADTYLSMNAPIQLAAAVLLEQRKNIQPLLLDRLRVNLAQLDDQLKGQKSTQRLQVDGGWYAVLRVPVTRTDEDLAIALLRQASVLVHPGHFYDFPSDGYLILSLLTRHSANFAKAHGAYFNFLFPNHEDHRGN